MTSKTIFDMVCSVKNGVTGANTPQQIVDAMLSLVPSDFWKNPNNKVLEVNTKSRVFLDTCFRLFRENLDVSDDYIWRNMLYAGCVNGAMKIVVKNEAPDIINVEVWSDYMKLSDVNFDLVVGNPPYSISDGSGHGGGGSEGYSSFVTKAYELSKRYVSMIIPSRWYSGGRGKALKAFRKFMLDTLPIVEFHDILSAEIFGKAVYVSGGVCYFLADKERTSKDVSFYFHDRDGNITKSVRPMRLISEDIMCRNINQAAVIAAVEQVDGFTDEDGSVSYKSFDSLVSVLKPYGFRTNAFYVSNSRYSWSDFSDVQIDNAYRCLGIDMVDDAKHRSIKWWPYNLDFVAWNENRHSPDCYRVFVPYGLYDKNDRFCIESIVARPGDICTETFLSVGEFDSFDIAYNVASYMKTKFFRYLLTVYKQSQNTAKDMYRAIPIQDFSILWTDDMLYKRYNLPQHLTDVIESSIMTDTSPVRCDLTEVSDVK